MTGLWVIVVLKVWRISVRRKCTVEGKVHLIHAFFFVVFALQRQGSGAAAGNNKTSGEQDASKTDVPEDFDIDMEDPETEKAAVAIQSQFRKFQKKKRVEKS
uniref:Purkinje cell protein 4 n=1 Tax=Sparus aurata TaxID=8175 RepID=A0A671UB81_SPAAU